MKTYEVEVNGQVYIVKLREITEEEANDKVVAPKTPVEKAVEQQPKKETPAGQVMSGDGEQVVAPMAGVILSVAKNTGDTVKKGDVLFILEAMKLENEILAPADGVVKAVFVSSNQAVESNQPLMTI